MSREVFLEPMKLAEDRDWCITIGGGDPRGFRMAAVEKRSCQVIATNLNHLRIPCAYVRDESLPDASLPRNRRCSFRIAPGSRPNPEAKPAPGSRFTLLEGI